MHMSEQYYTVKAFVKDEEGTMKLVQWASGFTHEKAREYFWNLKKTKDFSMINMSLIGSEEIENT